MRLCRECLAATMSAREEGSPAGSMVVYKQAWETEGCVESPLAPSPSSAPIVA